MSCNTKTSLAAVIDAVNAQLNNNYVDRDDPRINQGVFTEPTIRGGLMLDEAAKLDFCGYVTECGQREPFGKQWVDRPLYPHNTLVSYDDEGEIKSRWQDIDDVVAGTEIGESYTTYEETRSLGLQGYTIIDSFEIGATITQRDQALRHAVDGKLYRWAGDLPKDVPASSTPTSSGGIGTNAWLEVSDSALRQELSALGGVSIIKGASVTISSVSDMQASIWLQAGMSVTTNSYHNETAFGGNTYIIEPATSQVIDGGSYISLDNGLVAKAMFPGGTVNLRQFGALDGTNATSAITAFAVYLRKTKLQGSAVGEFTITAPLELDLTYTLCDYDLRLTTVNDSEFGMRVKHRASVSTGKILLICGGGTNLAGYNERRQVNGVEFYDTRASELMAVEVHGVKRDGIAVRSGGSFGNSNMTTAPRFTTAYCGAIKGMFSDVPESIVNNGASTSYGQQGVLTFTNPVPEHLRSMDFLLINDLLYMVQSVGSDLKTVNVFPHLASTTPEVTHFLIGTGTGIYGLDSNVLGAEVIDSVYSPVGVKLASFYGASVGRLHAGNGGTIGAAIMSGSAPNSSALGGSIGYLYTESLLYDVVQCSVAATNWAATSGNRSPTKVVSIAPSLFQHSVAAQNLSESSSVSFNRVTVGSPRSSLGQFTTFSVAGLAAVTNYILLAEKKSGGKTVSLEVFGRGVASNSTGSTHFSAKVVITQTNTTGYTASLDVDSDKIIKLCTLTYEGKSWFALDMTAMGIIEHSFYRGVTDPTSDSVRAVKTATVSDVVALDYKATQTKIVGDLTLAMDGKTIGMKSPNGTAYKLSIDDSGALVITPA